MAALSSPSLLERQAQQRPHRMVLSLRQRLARARLSQRLPSARKYTKICEEAGWLQTKVMKAEGAPTTHYSVDDDKFLEWILEFLRNESEISENPGLSKIQESILTDTIPDTIPEATSKTPAPSKRKEKATDIPVPARSEDGQPPAISWQRRPPPRKSRSFFTSTPAAPPPSAAPSWTP